MDGRHADPEPLGDRAHRQEMLGTQELRPPQIRRNLVRGRVSIPSIGWILWQAFDGDRRLDSSVVEGLPRLATPSHGWGPTLPQVRDQGVAGSNPVSPTQKALERLGKTDRSGAFDFESWSLAPLMHQAAAGSEAAGARSGRIGAFASLRNQALVQ